MIREDLIADCINGTGDWDLLTWDEIELIQDRIHDYITSQKFDTYRMINSHTTFQ